KRKREEDREKKKDKINNGINKYFNSNPVVSAPKSKPVATAEDAAFMADLLGEVDTNAPSQRARPMKAVRSEDRKKTRLLSPPISEEARTIPKLRGSLNTFHMTQKSSHATHLNDDDTYFSQLDDDDVPMSDPLPSSPVAKAIERKSHLGFKAEEEDEDDLMEVAQVVGHTNAYAASVNMAGSRPALQKLKKTNYPTPESSSPTRLSTDAIDASSWNNVTSKLNVLSSPPQETASGG
ncbi:DNA-directed DNA polymerase alpha catalytic subunit pol1, partial [Cryomyces antarcticus]